MSKIRIVIALLAGIGLVTMAAASFLPGATPKPTSSSQVATPVAVSVEPASFSEVRRRDLTPRPTATDEYVSPSDLGERHRVFVGLKPRSYDALANAKSNSPMVVLLHGADRDGRSMLDMWQNTVDSHGVTLVAPNGSKGGWTSDDAALLLAVIEDARIRYGTDPDRVFLFGHSAGAIAAQLFANHIDGPWRAVATHGGYIEHDGLGPFGAQVPVRMYLGSSDALFNPADGRKTAQRLAELGHKTEYHLIPEHGHWYYVIGPQLAAEASDWFLQF